jgi:hypothetical protein
MIILSNILHAYGAEETSRLLVDAHASLASVAFHYEWDWAGAENHSARRNVPFSDGWILRRAASGMGAIDSR